MTPRSFRRATRAITGGLLLLSLTACSSSNEAAGSADDATSVTTATQTDAGTGTDTGSADTGTADGLGRVGRSDRHRGRVARHRPRRRVRPGVGRRR